jgi:hypothetical protein
MTKNSNHDPGGQVGRNDPANDNAVAPAPTGGRSPR